MLFKQSAAVSFPFIHFRVCVSVHVHVCMCVCGGGCVCIYIYTCQGAYVEPKDNLQERVLLSCGL